MIRVRKKVWDDLRTPVNNLKVPASNNPDWVAYRGGQALAFGDQAVLGNEEIVYFNIQLPHTYRERSDIEVHVHWTPEDATGGFVRWLFTYSLANINSVFPANSELVVNAACTTTLNTHQYNSIGVIDGSDVGISSMLICSLKRNSSDAGDTYAGKDAYLLEIDAHFEKNSSGSRQYLVK